MQKVAFKLSSSGFTPLCHVQRACRQREGKCRAIAAPAWKHNRWRHGMNSIRHDIIHSDLGLLTRPLSRSAFSLSCSNPPRRAPPFIIANKLCAALGWSCTPPWDAVVSSRPIFSCSNCWAPACPPKKLETSWINPETRMSGRPPINAGRHPTISWVSVGHARPPWSARSFFGFIVNQPSATSFSWKTSRCDAKPIPDMTVMNQFVDRVSTT